MSFWIFKCNPALFRIEDRLADTTAATTWSAFQHRDEMRPGDTAFLWVTGPDRGIRAVLRIDEAPRKMAELEHEQKFWSERDTEVHWRVLCTISHRDVKLSAKMLRGAPGLQNFSMFHGEQRGTNFPITADEGAIIMRLISSGPG